MGCFVPLCDLWSAQACSLQRPGSASRSKPPAQESEGGQESFRGHADPDRRGPCGLDRARVAQASPTHQRFKTPVLIYNESRVRGWDGGACRLSCVSDDLDDSVSKLQEREN